MASLEAIRNQVEKRSAGECEFLQALDEFLDTARGTVIESDPEYLKVLERLVEPDRAIMFRVAWIDDKGKQQVNRGYRVQFNSALGPYKGGLRFHPSVNLSIVKFLGFEQIFKNALTGVLLGGGKGGSDFDPKGKSDGEVMRFCQAFMSELYRHIGANRDVPAGDIGVGGREIGYLFGQYKKITAQFEGVLTGKGFEWGGSRIRPEATGYGLVYISQAFLETKGDSLKGKKVAVSGSGNVAQYTIEKLLAIGAIPITASDSSGFCYKEDGFTKEDLQNIMKIKNEQRGRISELESDSIKYNEGEKPWKHVKCDFVMPCATQNEVDLDDVKALKENGCKGLFEGANMPSSKEAIDFVIENDMLFIPAKAANAGGVATSGLEMAQDSQFLQWKREEVDDKLQEIMKNILQNCLEAAEKVDKKGNLLVGANLAGFFKVAAAMKAQGVV